MHAGKHNLDVTDAVHWPPIYSQLPFDFLVDFLQVFLGEFLDWPSDAQTAIVRFLRFGDDMEVDVRNDLADHLSVKDRGYRRCCCPHLVSNTSVVLCTY